MLGGNHLATNIYFWTMSRWVLVGFRQGTNIFVDNVQESGPAEVGMATNILWTFWTMDIFVPKYK
jgi:hypothetical protein